MRAQWRRGRRKSKISVFFLLFVFSLLITDQRAHAWKWHCGPASLSLTKRVEGAAKSANSNNHKSKEPGRINNSRLSNKRQRNRVQKRKRRKKKKISHPRTFSLSCLFLCLTKAFFFWSLLLCWCDVSCLFGVVKYGLLYMLVDTTAAFKSFRVHPHFGFELLCLPHSAHYIFSP